MERYKPQNLELDRLTPKERATALAETRTTYCWDPWRTIGLLTTDWIAERRHAKREQLGFQESRPQPAVRVWVRAVDRRKRDEGRGGQGPVSRVERVTDDQLRLDYHLSPDVALASQTGKLEQRHKRLLKQLAVLEAQLHDIRSYRERRAAVA